MGIPWSDTELKVVIAIREAGNYENFAVPAEYVRRGAKSVEDYEKLKAEDAKYEKDHGSKRVEAMTREELEDRVKDTMPRITKDVPTDELRKEASKEPEPKAEEPKAKPSSKGKKK